VVVYNASVGEADQLEPAVIEPLQASVGADGGGAGEAQGRAGADAAPVTCPVCGAVSRVRPGGCSRSQARLGNAAKKLCFVPPP